MIASKVLPENAGHGDSEAQRLQQQHRDVRQFAYCAVFQQEYTLMVCYLNIHYCPVLADSNVFFNRFVAIEVSRGDICAMHFQRVIVNLALKDIAKWDDNDDLTEMLLSLPNYSVNFPWPQVLQYVAKYGQIVSLGCPEEPSLKQFTMNFVIEILATQHLGSGRTRLNCDKASGLRKNLP